MIDDKDSKFCCSDNSKFLDTIVFKQRYCSTRNPKPKHIIYSIEIIVKCIIKIQVFSLLQTPSDKKRSKFSTCSYVCSKSWGEGTKRTFPPVNGIASLELNISDKVLLNP